MQVIMGETGTDHHHVDRQSFPDDELVTNLTPQRQYLELSGRMHDLLWRSCAIVVPLVVALELVVGDVRADIKPTRRAVFVLLSKIKPVIYRNIEPLTLSVFRHAEAVGLDGEKSGKAGGSDVDRHALMRAKHSLISEHDVFTETEKKTSRQIIPDHVLIGPLVGGCAVLGHRRATQCEQYRQSRQYLFVRPHRLF